MHIRGHTTSGLGGKMRARICAVVLVVFAFALYPATSMAAPGDSFHVVRKGETLSAIASEYSVTVADIVEANDLANPDFIWVGQRLRIPKSEGEADPTPRASETYIVRPGDTLTLIALRYHVSLQALATANNLADWDMIYVGEQLEIPGSTENEEKKPSPPSNAHYVVHPGDTLSTIADRFGVDMEMLAAINGISNPSFIYVGQVLTIPGSVPDAPPSGAKKIVVDVSSQRMYVYQGDTLLHVWVVSTGRGGSTRYGTFHVQSKVRNAYGSTWNIWMPYWLGIYWAGPIENGIHGQPINPDGSIVWAGWLGRPITFGCVMLRTDHARWLYNWADIGTPVIIRP